jgi:hypothetical protein
MLRLRQYRGFARMWRLESRGKNKEARDKMIR